MDKEHVFKASATWSDGDFGHGTASAQGFPGVTISLPSQFGGTLPGTNPEELLLSALASCLAMTTGFLLDGRVIAFEAIEVEATGVVVRGPLRFDSFDIVIRVKMPKDADTEAKEAALNVASRADEKCMMSHLVQ